MPATAATTPVGPIVLCDDGSPAARAAITAAAATLAPAPAVVLHTWLPLSHLMLWNPLLPAPGPLVEPAAELDEPGRLAAQRLAEDGASAARDAGFADVTARIEARRHGSWRTLLAVADDLDARLVVLGSHGTSPVRGCVLGSVALGIVHHAERPFLVVPFTPAP